MTTLVSGGAGFIGSHLCDALLAAGHRVACVDDFSLGTGANIAHLRGNENFVCHEGDVNDAAFLGDVFAAENPELVMHLAANSDIQASATDPQVEYRNTYTTTFGLLEQMRLHDVKRFFFASTSAVYGDKRDTPLTEETPNLAPVSYYGAAKLGGEALVSAYTAMNDMQSLVFRFPNVVGPRLTHGAVYDFIRKLRKDPARLEILGDGKQTKPYVYVLDLIEAIMQRMQHLTPGVTLYNVGVETATSVTRMADIVCEEMGLAGVRYEYTGGEGGWKGDVPRFQYGLDKIHATGWRPRHTSDDAIRAAVRAELGKQ